MEEYFRAGSVAGTIWPANMGNPFVTSLLHDKVAKMLSIDEDKMDIMLESLPASVFKTMIPAYSYPNQENDINAFAVAVYLVASDKLPEETVYEVTKAFFDNHEHFSIVHSSAAEWTLESTIEGNVAIPFHPGAIKYFEEKGLWTEELQSKQDSLLKK